MKKLIVGVILSLVAVSFVALPVLAAAFTITFTVTNTGGTSYAALPVIEAMSNADLAYNKYITSTGLDTKVIVGSATEPHMLTDNTTLFVAPVPAGSSTTVQYTTGNPLATSFPIIAGLGGYVVTPYNSSLDLGNSANISIPASITSTAGNVLDWPGTLNVHSDGAGSVTATLPQDSITYASEYDAVADYDINSMTAAGGFVYWGYGSMTAGTAKVVQLDATTLTQTGIWNASGSEANVRYLYDDGSYLYAGMNAGTQGIIVKLDTSSMTEVARWTSSSGHAAISGLADDGTYLYSATASGGTTRKVVKILKADMSEVTAYNSSLSGPNYGIAYQGGAVYTSVCVSSGGHYELEEISAPSLTFMADYDTGVSVGSTGGLVASDGTYLYYAFPASGGARVDKVNSVCGLVQRWTGSGSDTKAMGVTAGPANSIYVTIYDVPSRVVELNTTTMTEINAYSGTSGQNYAFIPGYDGSFVYAAFYTSPSKILAFHTDLALRTTYDPSLSVTATGVSLSDVPISVTLTPTTFSINAGGHTASTASSGASANVSGNDLTWMSDATPWVDSINISVSGTPVLTYAPATILSWGTYGALSGAIMPDNSAYGNRGLVVFGSNPADVSGGPISLVPSKPAQAPPYTLGSGAGSLFPPSTASSNFGTGNMLHVIIAMIVILGLSLATSALIRLLGSGSLILKTAVITGLLGIFVAMPNTSGSYASGTWLDFWMVIFFLFWAIAMMMGSKQITWQ